MAKYSQSENAMREFKTSNYRTQMGRTRVDIHCPFCGTISTAYVWSLAGGGKKCENRDCGAKHTSFGQTIPVEGREDIEP